MNQPDLKVLIVDDNSIICKIMSNTIQKISGWAVVGICKNGQEAILKIQETKPDLVLLDLYMPIKDGFDVLASYKNKINAPKFVVFTGSSNGDDSQKAFSLGASNFVIKEEISRSKIGIHKALEEAFNFAMKTSRSQPKNIQSNLRTYQSQEEKLKSPLAVVIGSSTGGPEALQSLFSSLPSTFSLPIFLVQHIKPEFMAKFAERLSSIVTQDVVQVDQLTKLKKNTIYLSSGKKHIKLVGNLSNLSVAPDDSDPVHFCKPAVDVLFNSAAPIYKKRLLGVVLTGMGQDGLEGSRNIVSNGGQIIVQDKASSVVWGMPGVIANEGLASRIIPIQKMMENILEICT